MQAIKSNLLLTQKLYKYRYPLSLFLLIPVWVTIQVIPLPAELIAAVSPKTAELYINPGAYFTFSLEPAKTKQMAMLSWAFYLFFILTILLVDSHKRLKLLLTVIVMCGVAQALYGSFMTLSGLEYGFFREKTDYVGRATGTFINRNHLAGYLEMSLAAGVGLLVAALNRKKLRGWRSHLRSILDSFLGSKVRTRIFLAIMVIALVLTRSRMGNTAFFVSLPLCGMLMMTLQKRLNLGAILLFVSLLLIDFYIVGQWFGFEELAARIESTSVDHENRDELARDTFIMIQDFPVSGTGAGTFYSSFPQARSSNISGFNYHAHNDYLEFASDFGMLGFIPLALLVLLSLHTAAKVMKKRHDRLMIGAAFASFMGVTSLLIHSTVDFNLQMPANALLFIVLLALAQLAKNLRGGARH